VRDVRQAFAKRKKLLFAASGLIAEQKFPLFDVWFLCSGKKNPVKGCDA
jgi:hypothetical protein